MPDPPTKISISETLPAYVAVPAASSTTTPAVSAEKSSVSLPPPPELEATLPPANTKVSLSKPPERFSIALKARLLTVPAAAAVTDQVFSVSAPTTVSSPSWPSRPPASDPPSRSTNSSLSFPPSRYWMPLKLPLLSLPLLLPLICHWLPLSPPRIRSLPPLPVIEPLRLPSAVKTK